MRVPNAKNETFFALAEPISHCSDNSRPSCCLDSSSQSLTRRKNILRDRPYIMSAQIWTYSVFRYITEDKQNWLFYAPTYPVLSPNMIYGWFLQKLKYYCGFLEHWNSQKSVCNIWQRFSCLLDEGIPKIWKKLSSHCGFLRADQGMAKNPVGWAELAVQSYK